MKPGELLDDHRIDGWLGGGGYGDTYKVTHSTSGETSALKISKDTGDPVDLERFNAENEIMHRLHPHENIIAPLSRVIALPNNASYYKMELADFDLSEYLKNNPDLSTSERMSVFRQICSGIRHAHANEIVHRDLHWNNILFKDGPLTLTVKLADFGKSRDFSKISLSDPEKPCWGAFVFPPENKFNMWENPENDHYIVGDMYAIGILLFSIFKSLPYPEVVSLQSEIVSFLSRSGIEITDLSYSDRQNLYRDWIASMRLENSYLSVNLLDTDETNRINSLLSKLTHIDREVRFKNIEELEREMANLQI